MKQTHSSALPSEKGSINFKDRSVSFKVRQNKRIKRSRLLVSAEEGLIVESPKGLSLRTATKIIHNRKDWVISALEGIEEKRKAIHEIKQFEDSILVYGKEKRIEVRRGQIKDYILESKSRIILGFVSKRLQPGQINNVIEDWLREKAKKYLQLRVKKLCGNLFKINNVVVKGQKTLWGSCSSDNNINLNWRLVMAPKFASDYIIIHELCHTRHLNHSKKYWALVEDVCPNYHKAEEWFDRYGFVLHFEFDF